MCFTPKVSLSTAIIEWLIAFFIYYKYNKSFLSKFLFIFIFILGFYQFTEYMLCTSGDIQLWGKLGFITYTFLPAIGLHFVLSYTKNKINKLIIYLPVLIIILMTVANDNFIISGSCSKMFVKIENYFYNSANPVATAIYLTWYFLNIIIIAVYLINGIRKTRNKTLIVIYLTILSTTLLTIIPPVILFVVFPSLSYEFPSIYCQFALLFSIMALFGAYLDDKLKFRFKHLLKDIAHKLKM